MIKFLVTHLFLLLLFGCTHHPTQHVPSNQFTNTESIELAKSHDDPNAILFNQHISNINYQLIFVLDPNNDIDINAQLNFSLDDTDSSIALYLLNKNLDQMTINGMTIYPDYDGKKITIAKELLKEDNHLTLSYKIKTTDGFSGLKHWHDPTDNSQYLYTDFTNMGAQSLFPSFANGQAAHFELFIFAPKTWQVVGSGIGHQVPKINVANNYNIKLPQHRNLPKNYDEPQTNNMELWQFNSTQNIAPKNMVFAAGQFKKIIIKNKHVPLAFYYPQSQIPNINSKNNEILAQLNNSQIFLTEFEQYTQSPYPFKQYQQIWLPVHNMDNNEKEVTGASINIFLNANLLNNDIDKKYVIYPAIAMQWLLAMPANSHISPKGLSHFLTYQIMQSQADPSPWQYFSQRKQNIAYQNDKVHAFNSLLYTQIKDTALLRQLEFWLGEHQIKLAIQNVIQSYQLTKKPKLSLLAQIEKVTQKELGGWQQEWENTANNHIQVKWQCLHDRISHIYIEQTSANNALLSNQKVQLAFFNIYSYGIDLEKTIPAFYTNQLTELPHLIGENCPDFIFPNYQDFAYTQVKFTNKQLTSMGKHLYQISDPLLNLMIWQNLWQAVLSGTLSTKEYLTIVAINLPKQQNLFVNQQIIKSFIQLQQFINYAPVINPSFSYVVAKVITEISIQKIIENKTHPKLQQLWLNAYIELANTKSELTHLVSMLKGHAPLYPILSQQQRWHIIQQLSRYHHPLAINLIAQESQKDHSKQKIKERLKAYVIYPLAKQKQQALTSLRSLDNDLQQAVMANIYPAEQFDLQLLTMRKQLDKLQRANVIYYNYPNYIENYSTYLSPIQCNKEMIATYNKMLKSTLPAKLVHIFKRKKLFIQQCINVKYHLE